MDRDTLIARLQQGQSGQGLLGGKGLSDNVLNLALIMGGLRALGPQPAGQNLASNIAQGVSEGLQLGAAFQPKAPLFGEQETQFQKGVGTKGAERYVKTQDDATNAYETIKNYDNIGKYVNLLEEGSTGSLAEARLSLQKFGKLVGIPVDESDITAKEAIIKTHGQMVLQGLSAFKGAISDGERAFTKDITGGGIGDTKDTILFSAEMSKNEAKGKILDSEAANIFRQLGGNFVDAIETEPGVTENFESFAKRYRLSKGWTPLPIEAADVLRNMSNQSAEIYKNTENYVRDPKTGNYAFINPKNQQVVEFMSLTEQQYNERFGVR